MLHALGYYLLHNSLSPAHRGPTSVLVHVLLVSMCHIASVLPISVSFVNAAFCKPCSYEYSIIREGRSEMCG